MNSNTFWTCFWLLTTLVIFALPILYSEFVTRLSIFNYTASTNTNVIIGVYGSIVLARFLLQFLFALLNRARMSINRIRHDNTTFNIVVPSYKENIEYFTMCIRSLKNLVDKDDGLRKIIFVIDGNEPSDMYMLNALKNEIPQQDLFEYTILDLQTPVPLVDFSDISRRATNYKFVCIMQPHMSKRHAMMTGIELSQTVDYILFTDSDTVILSEAPTFLASFLDYNENCGVVTGNVRIFNLNSLLCFMNYLKYWMAFNLERASQSLFGTIVCASGPLSMYRKSDLNMIKHEWLNQTFLGQPCTYGDDRHLTTCILKLGKSAYFHHRAECYTETPANWSRWFSQQTRWTKSAHRETLLLFGIFQTRLWNLWFIFDTAFTFWYGFFLALLSLLLIFNSSEGNGVALMGGSIFALAMLRSLFAVVLDWDWRHFYFGLYGYVYYLFLLPIKLWAVLTAFDNRWGTSPRAFLGRINFLDTIPVLGWNFMLFGGIVSHYIKNNTSSSNGWEILAIVGVAIGIYVLFVVASYSTLHGKIQKIVNSTQFTSPSLQHIGISGGGENTVESKMYM